MKKRTAVGIDVGGTVNKVGLVDESGAILERADFETADAHSPAAWLDRVETAILRFRRSGWKPVGIGAGVPGFVDFKRGFIYQLTNIDGWRNQPIAERIRSRFGLPAFVDNDVNAMALGECTFGAGRKHSNAVFATLGTGVGGAVYINGALYRGAHSMAGEIGHIPILMNGHKTREGRGGLETYVGIKSITGNAVKAIKSGRKSLILKLAGGDIKAITPKTIACAAHKKDPLALEIFDKMAECLATAFAGVTYLLQPEVIIVGGGVSCCGKPLFAPLRAHLKERLNPIFAKRISIEPATLGNSAGMIGSACLVFESQN